ncbi:hypothetical protein U1Q18_027358, partial [Sarracenia purpurea var. burkii]
MKMGMCSQLCAAVLGLDPVALVAADGWGWIGVCCYLAQVTFIGLWRGFLVQFVLWRVSYCCIYDVPWVLLGAIVFAALELQQVVLGPPLGLLLMILGCVPWSMEGLL